MRGEEVGWNLITGIRINKPSQAQARGNGQFAVCIYCGMLLLLLLRADKEGDCMSLYGTKVHFVCADRGGPGPAWPTVTHLSDRKKTFCQTNKNTIHHSAHRRRSEAAQSGIYIYLAAHTHTHTHTHARTLRQTEVRSAVWDKPT